MTPKQIKDAADRAEGAIRDPETGQFVKGKIGGPGRPKGSRNALGEAFLADLHAAWQERGPGVIERVIDERPQDFLKVVASILPKDFNVNVNSMDTMTDDELIQRIRQIDATIRPFLDAEGTDGFDGGVAKATAH